MKEKCEVFKHKALKHPGIESIGIASKTPGEEFDNFGIELPEGKKWAATVFGVDYDLIETLQMEVIKGRNFSREYRRDSLGTFIVNQAAVEELGLKDPIGYELSIDWFKRKGPIVGVVRDFHFQSLHNKIKPLVFTVEAVYYTKILVRLADSNLDRRLLTVKKVWNDVFPGYPFEYSFLDEDIERMYSTEYVTSNLLKPFALFALLIACIGLIGLVVCTVDQRIKEIGIRKSIGASVGSIVGLFTLDLLKWILFANFIAWIIMWFIADAWLKNFAYRTEITFPVFILASFITLALAMATTGLYAYRAATLNPVVSLRYE